MLAKCNKNPRFSLTHVFSRQKISPDEIYLLNLPRASVPPHKLTDNMTHAILLLRSATLCALLTLCLGGRGQTTLLNFTFDANTYHGTITTTGGTIIPSVGGLTGEGAYCHINFDKGGNGEHISVGLTGTTLTAGDRISVTIYRLHYDQDGAYPSGISLATAATADAAHIDVTATAGHECYATVSYTVGSGDILSGSALFYVGRLQNKGSIYVKRIVVERPGSATLSDVPPVPDATTPLAPQPSATGRNINVADGGIVTLTDMNGGTAKFANDFNAITNKITLSPSDNTITLSNNKSRSATDIHVVVTKSGCQDAVYAIPVTIEKQPLRLEYTTATGSDTFTWSHEGSETLATAGDFTQPTVKAYIVWGDGRAEEQLAAVPDEVTYASDRRSVASVADDGTIALNLPCYGQAIVYASFPGNSKYAAAEQDAAFTIDIRQGYTYKIDKSTRFAGDANHPAVNELVTIKDATATPLVAMVFGGWQWGNNEGRDNHKYNISSEKTVNGVTTTSSSTKEDKWKEPDADDVTDMDGFSYATSGNADAADEAKRKSGYQLYGNYRYGWFDPTAGVETPFTLPVRGAFMTFNTKKNGQLTLYLLQNGAFNTKDLDDDGKLEIVPGEFRAHAFFLANQHGVNVIAENSIPTHINTLQKVGNGFYCNPDETGATTPDTGSKNVYRWPEFRQLINQFSESETKLVAAWANGVHGTETPIMLGGGKFLVVQKGIVKYTFHATANETYYFFSNFSKMGFCGANFIPDATQPTALASLSETEAYSHAQDQTQYKKVTVERRLRKGQWNTLSLPFDMTQDEVKRLFGWGTQIIVLSSSEREPVKGVRLHFLYHEIQNILAGYPYLIKPTFKYKNGDTYGDMMSGTHAVPEFGDGVTIDTDGQSCTSFWVANKQLNAQQQTFDTGPHWFKPTPGYSLGNVTKPGGTGGYTINYLNNDIFISDADGQLYVSTGSSYAKGYRAYIEPKQRELSGNSKIAAVSYASFINDDEETTAIDPATLTAEARESLALDDDVYNLQGQRVAPGEGALPKGIYITRCRKIVRR